MAPGTGRKAFEGGQHRLARAHLRAVMDAGGPHAEDATFFYAASFFRDQAWGRARHEFKRLIRRFPQGRWAPAAHWHVGITELRSGRVGRARARFELVVRRFPRDPVTAANARAELRRLDRRREGLVARLWREWTEPL